MLLGNGSTASERFRNSGGTVSNPFYWKLVTEAGQ